MGNLIQYIAQENPDKNEPWQTPALRNNLCERKSTILSNRNIQIPTRDVFRPAKLSKADWKVSDKVLRVGLNMLLIHLLVIFIKE